MIIPRSLEFELFTVLPWVGCTVTLLLQRWKIVQNVHEGSYLECYNKVTRLDICSQRALLEHSLTLLLMDGDPCSGSVLVYRF